MVLEPTPVLVLAVGDAGIFVVALSGYLLLRRLRPAGVLDMRGAFQVLDRSITKYVPELSAGFTWREAFKRLEEDGVKVDWNQMRKRLDEYEAYRYGGREAPRGGQADVVKLAQKLRGSVVGRTKTKGARSS